MTTDRKRPMTISLADSVRDELEAQAGAAGTTMSDHIAALVRAYGTKTAQRLDKARAGVKAKEGQCRLHPLPRPAADLAPRAIVSELTPERLAELKAQDFPVAEVDTSAYTVEDAERIRAHFSQYIAARDACPCCNEAGHWQWRILHGVGECERCHYPLRVYHYVTLADGTSPRILTRALYYQPNELTIGSDDV